MYKRLVTFGCSNTFGQGLKDCVADNDILKPGPNPSKFAWPQLLANQMKIECVNMAQPGGSNKLIWWRTVNFEFEPTDLVIFSATYPDREMVLENDANVWNNFGPWTHEGQVSRSRAFQKWLTETNSRRMWEYQSYVHLDHAYQHVIRQGVKTILHFRHRDETYQHDLPDWVTFKWQPQSMMSHSMIQDKAACGHPGPRSHVMAAMQTYRNLRKLNHD